MKQLTNSTSKPNPKLKTVNNESLVGKGNIVTTKNVNGDTEIKFWTGTEEEHAALGSIDANTLYFKTKN